MKAQPSFDSLASIYELLEQITYGPLLHKCRTMHLDRLRACRRALILGDGDGRFLIDLLKTNPHVIVDTLDNSPSMLAQARRRVMHLPGTTKRVRFLCADARCTSVFEDGYDLIVTNFFLDCFPAAELKALIDRVASLGCASSIWIDGDFRIPPGRWTQLIAWLVLSGMYIAFVLMTRIPAYRLIDSAPVLQKNGYSLKAERILLRGFLSSRVWERKM